MKKICSIGIVLICIVITLSGCGTKVTVVNTTENNGKVILSTDNLVSIIDNRLYYDSNTRIVYWWNGCSGKSEIATTPTPYYAPNGLPYKYNPDTNTLEEITE